MEFPGHVMAYGYHHRENIENSSVQFSRSVVSDSLQLHESGLFQKPETRDGRIG